MLLILTGAAISGTLLPLGLRLFTIDPALASDVIAKTVTDVRGNLCLLGLATLLLQYVIPVAQEVCLLRAKKEAVCMHDPAYEGAQPAPIATALFVEQSGAGPALLLIHGLMVSGAMYQGVLPALASHYRVIVPDLRGHGRSGGLPGPYSVEQLAHDLAQLLDDLHLDAAHVLGYSQGGAVAQQFARDYPKRVRGLILACTFAYNMLSRRERLEGMLGFNPARPEKLQRTH